VAVQEVGRCLASPTRKYQQAVADAHRPTGIKRFRIAETFRIAEQKQDCTALD
jgi:hypothetical protein